MCNFRIKDRLFPVILSFFLTKLKNSIPWSFRIFSVKEKTNPTMKLNLFLLLGFLYCFTAKAQQLPNSNIMLFELNQKNDSTFLFNNPQYLTNFNKDGYNNQPYFITDNELYITVQLSTDTCQTDIYSLNLANKEITQVTATIESEYSPTFIPPTGSEKNYEFSSVRSDKAGNQNLWRFPINRSSKGSPVLNTIKNIGYHYWIDYRDIVLFVVDKPHKMLVADTRDESARFVTANIGRCFQELPDGSVAFVEKMSDDSWLLKKMDARTYRTSLITATLAKSEDFTILRDGTIIMAFGAKLYKFNQRIDTTWKEIANLSFYGMDNISRIAVNGAENKIAIVVE
ncbi:MAG: hypothetical protein ACI8P3_004130 [Saprospiraceae bacterium]